VEDVLLRQGEGKEDESLAVWKAKREIQYYYGNALEALLESWPPRRYKRRPHVGRLNGFG
jgi:hypothetical protein